MEHKVGKASDQVITQCGMALRGRPWCMPTEPY